MQEMRELERERRGAGEAPPWCDRCVGMTIFTKEMKDRGIMPVCAGLRTRFPYDSARRELMMGDEEQSGEIEFIQHVYSIHIYSIYIM